ncbi:uncharacterized protein AC631_04528 [Debaryomyces fabryi]|uniref:GPI transamidase component GAB1 n=1 Tax=Debaryomyces fabryi TaxID=58627 RepID=A0A0V1PTY0_9ASCO|nr:uncharacterized protein AC631_04528 [Debaryomyces fabryi]KRZ99719.1 hypothetical protein AC631_04528 [Debaryomyces fabryi]CUM46411.1 unnamed protein product [Debaryomyces fabryi]
MDKLMSVLLIGGLIRFVLPTILPRLPLNLSSSIEIATPLTSFKSLQEAFYYLQHDINLYDGGVNHHPPLLVILLNAIDEYLPRRLGEIVFNGVFTGVDLIIACRLIHINKWYNKHMSQRTGRSIQGFSDDLIAAFYLFNPLLILTNISHSTLCFTLMAITESLYQLVIRRNLPRSVISMAIASYLSFRPIFLIIPLLGLAHSLDRDWKTVYAHGIGLFTSACGILVLTSFMMTASFQFLDLCYGIVIKFNKITPNLGLWWYIFTEMFDFFTPFYVGVFNLFSIIFVIPFTLRLFEFNHKSAKPTGDAFLAVVTSYIWLSFTKSYPAVGDLAFALSLIPIFKDTVIPHCKYPFLTALVLLVGLLLSPIFYYCWIVLGTGNSNFFYSINLVWGIVHGLILTDLVWGKLIFDYIELNDVPAEQIPKLRLTQI